MGRSLSKKNNLPEKTPKRGRGIMRDFKEKIVQEILGQDSSFDEKVAGLLSQGIQLNTIAQKLGVSKDYLSDYISLKEELWDYLTEGQLRQIQKNSFAITEYAIKCIKSSVQKDPQVAKWWLSDRNKIIQAFSDQIKKNLSKRKEQLLKELKDEEGSDKKTINIKNLNVILRKAYEDAD